MSREMVAWVLRMPRSGLFCQRTGKNQLKPFQQLFLCLHRLLGNDLQQLLLTLIFHAFVTSPPIFLSKISQKLFLDSRTSFVVYLEVLTRT